MQGTVTFAIGHSVFDLLYSLMLQERLNVEYLIPNFEDIARAELNGNHTFQIADDISGNQDPVIVAASRERSSSR